MANIDKRIIRFIGRHHIFTLATSSENRPYTCTCFFVYEESSNRFIFTSDMDTRHAAEMLHNPEVSGAIALETKVIGRIQGIQFTGRAYMPDEALFTHAQKLYHQRFPVSALMKLTLWIIEPHFIKMTHNQLGFGKKLIWTKE